MVDAGAHTPESTLRGARDRARVRWWSGWRPCTPSRDLSAIVRLVGESRVVFSLDLRLGSPVLHPAMLDAEGALPDALSLAGQAMDCGVSSLVVLDLARIGTGCGTDLGLIEGLRKGFPDIRLLAGGGVLTRRDLDRMRDAGCDGALVASAIHAGTITAADLAALAAEPVGAQSPSVSR